MCARKGKIGKTQGKRAHNGKAKYGALRIPFSDKAFAGLSPRPGKAFARARFDSVRARNDLARCVNL